MDWLAAVVLRLAELGPWAPFLFIALYIAAAVTLAPAFLLTVAGARSSACGAGHCSCSSARCSARLRRTPCRSA